MGFWSSVEGAFNDLPVVGGLFGTAPGSNEGKAATDATATSRDEAANAYQQALDMVGQANQYAGPTPVGSTPVTAERVTAPDIQSGGVMAPATIDEGRYVDTEQAQAAAYNAATQNYQTTQAQAASVAGQQQHYMADTATAAQALAPATATTADVNTKVAAPSLSPAAQTAAVNVGAAKVGNVGISGLATDARSAQLAAAENIAEGPSSAGAQFKAGMDQVTADQISLANQARGNERAGARREAILHQGQQGAQAAESAAAIAAQEDIAKRTAASQALTGVRAADVTTATADEQVQAQQANLQASLDAQRASLQANLNAAIAEGNTAAVNSIKSQQANLELSAQQSSVQAGLSQQGTKASLAQSNLAATNQTAIANMQGANTVGLANSAATNQAAADYAAARNAALTQQAGNQQTTSLANAAADTGAARDYATALNQSAANYAATQTATSATNAAAERARAEANANRQVDITKANVGNALTAGQTNAQLATQTNIAQGTASLQAGTTSANNQLTAQTTNAASDLQAQTTNASNDLQAQQLRLSGETSGISGMNTSAGVQNQNANTIVGGQESAADAKQAQNDAQLGALSAGLTLAGVGAKKAAPAAGAAPAAAATAAGDTSDVRAKNQITRVPDSQIDDLAEKVKAYTWRYKPGVEDGGENVHAGALAQELERSALGKKLVNEDARGIKHVDVLSLAGLMAAAAARSARKNGRASA
jgi:trimeric autotransporter adhesin